MADAHPALAEPPAPEADRGGLDTVVFGVAAAVALAFVAWGFASPTGLGSVGSTTLVWIEENLGWLFVTLASAFVVYVLWLAASRYGRIPLGGDDEAPEFRTVSWIAMMFSAGMGIGLMFFGVSGRRQRFGGQHTPADEEDGDDRGHPEDHEIGAW